MKDVHDFLEEVIDEYTLLQFVKALIADKPNENNVPVDQISIGQRWQNDSVEGFLSAGVAWAEASNFGVSQKAGIADNPWYQFAVFLYCGKIYE